MGSLSDWGGNLGIRLWDLPSQSNALPIRSKDLQICPNDLPIQLNDLPIHPKDLRFCPNDLVIRPGDL